MSDAASQSGDNRPSREQYEAVVAALRGITETAESIFSDREIREIDMRKAVAVARAALAKAGGER